MDKRLQTRLETSPTPGNGQASLITLALRLANIDKWDQWHGTGRYRWSMSGQKIVNKVGLLGWRIKQLFPFMRSKTFYTASKYEKEWDSSKHG